MMFEWELEEVEKKLGAAAGLKLKFKALDVVRPILRMYNGIELEDVLWIFKDPVDALQAVLHMKKELAKYNKKHPGLGNEMGISGYGIHMGEMLFINKTDVHWGDPVNTSSKLG